MAGSRQYQDFDGYLIPEFHYARLAQTGLPLPVGTSADDYLTRELAELTALLIDVDAHAGGGTLPGVTLTPATGLHITPLEATVPPRRRR